jgi:tetratricopeptide (TPR) repeat protein
MKKIIYILFYIFLLTNTACEKYVDIEQRGVATAASISDLRQILNDEIALGYGNELFFSDEIGQIPLGTYNSIIMQSARRAYGFEDYIYNELETDNDWAGLYKTIGVANYVLQNVDILPDPTNEGDVVKGEALVHRAYCYFFLVNLYAKNYTEATAVTEPGVPLLKTFGDPDASLKRATVKEVYDQIIEDLNNAKDLLPVSSNFNIKPNKVAALAFLSKVYLQMGKYDLARDNASAALELNSTVLDYNTLPVADVVLDQNFANIEKFSVRPAERKNPEMIFYSWSQFSVDLGPLFSGSILSMSPSVSPYIIVTSDSFVTPAILALGNPYDIRFKNMIFTFEGRQRFVGIGNFISDGNAYSRGIDVPEVILIYAESLARTGDFNTAMTILNNFRAKRFFNTAPANAHILVAVNQAQAVQHILDERQREFMYRGKRMFDIKRLNAIHDANISVTHILPDNSTVTLNPNDNKWAIAIPPKEIALAPELTQNPR